MNQQLNLLSCGNIRKELGQQRNAADWFLFVPYRPWVLGRGMSEINGSNTSALTLLFMSFSNATMCPRKFLGM